ncbi:MAG TPA: ferric reductase-like transmembrane domain-containing protein [Solirubrobacteraceae bacterium]|nr:ferric reductase-like transmembrane domain-containing protein [Solirubrobacteraceae bacterium]
MSVHLTAIAATAVAPHIYWIASRAAGSAALLLSSASVCLGLASSMRLLKRRAADLRVTHEALALASLVALVVHGLTLLGDGFMHPTLAELAVPFLSGYETLWTTAGIVAFWMLAALGLSFYVRAKIGVQRWRMLHRFTALAWLLGLAHSLGEGSDAGQTWFLAMIAIAVVPALLLLAVRVLKGSSPNPVGAPARAAGADARFPAALEMNDAQRAPASPLGAVGRAGALR